MSAVCAAAAATAAVLTAPQGAAILLQMRAAACEGASGLASDSMRALLTPSAAEQLASSACVAWCQQAAVVGVAAVTWGLIRAVWPWLARLKPPRRSEASLTSPVAALGGGSGNSSGSRSAAGATSTSPPSPQQQQQQQQRVGGGGVQEARVWVRLSGNQEVLLSPKQLVELVPLNTPLQGRLRVTSPPGGGDRNGGKTGGAGEGEGDVVAAEVVGEAGGAAAEASHADGDDGSSSGDNPILRQRDGARRRRVWEAGAAAVGRAARASTAVWVAMADARRSPPIVAVCTGAPFVHK